MIHKRKIRVENVTLKKKVTLLRDSKTELCNKKEYYRLVDLFLVC